MSEHSPVALPFRYYVTYTAKSRTGFVRGAMDISRKHPVTDFAEVRLIIDLIAEEKPHLRDVLVTAWRRYETLGDADA